MVLEDMRTLKVGSRVNVSGHCGTILYTGNVVGTKGEWLGIDWDEPTRGKHNGTYNGVSYFKTRHPSSGSFIRPAKVTPPISCVDAIRNRYGFIEENAGVDLHSLIQVQKDIKAKVFEVVGAEKINKKQSQFDSLQIVSLRGQPISEVGPPNSLLCLCPNVRELDLSKTLIKNLKVVADIARQLPQLRLLNISENLFEVDGGIYDDAFKRLEHLVMYQTRLTWQEVLLCCKSIPHLTTLQVPFNHINNLSSAVDILPSLASLDLEGNSLRNWDEIMKLGCLPHLTHLNISSCNIKDISLPSDPGAILFPNLKQLLINDNAIADWVAISELDKLPSFQELKCCKNPVLSHESFETNHQIIIARIKNLKVLNGQAVTDEERRGAELDFLKRHGLEYLRVRADGDFNKFLALYPCYQRLVNCYGPPEEGELHKPSSALKNTLIQVELFSPTNAVKKKVPINMTIQKLTGLVQRVFDTGMEVPRLFYVHSSNDIVEIELDNEMKDLNFYSVEDNARIAVRW